MVPVSGKVSNGSFESSSVFLEHPYGSLRQGNPLCPGHQVRMAAIYQYITLRQDWADLCGQLQLQRRGLLLVLDKRAQVGPRGGLVELLWGQWALISTGWVS